MRSGQARFNMMAYGREKGAISARFLTYEEAVILHKKEESSEKIKTMYRGPISSNDYWLGTVHPSSSDNICYVKGSDGTIYYKAKNYAAPNIIIRVVLDIYKSDIT